MPQRPPKARIPRVPGANVQRPRIRRPNPHQALYDSPEWKALSKEIRRLQPHCQCDFHRGKPDAPKSDCVDHIVAHRGNRTLFFDRKNLRAMAWSCHTSKTNRHDGGFGQKVRPLTRQ